MNFKGKELEKECRAQLVNPKPKCQTEEYAKKPDEEDSKLFSFLVFFWINVFSQFRNRNPTHDFFLFL